MGLLLKQRVQIFSQTSSTLVPNTGAHSNYDCTPRYKQIYTVKYADDTTIISCIINNDESLYREEINKLQTGA